MTQAIILWYRQNCRKDEYILPYAPALYPSDTFGSSFAASNNAGLPVCASVCGGHGQCK